MVLSKRGILRGGIWCWNLLGVVCSLPVLASLFCHFWATAWPHRTGCISRDGHVHIVSILTVPDCADIEGVSHLCCFGALAWRAWGRLTSGPGLSVCGRAVDCGLGDNAVPAQWNGRVTTCECPCAGREWLFAWLLWALFCPTNATPAALEASSQLQTKRPTRPRECPTIGQNLGTCRTPSRSQSGFGPREPLTDEVFWYTIGSSRTRMERQWKLDTPKSRVLRAAGDCQELSGVWNRPLSDAMGFPLGFS